MKAKWKTVVHPLQLGGLGLVKTKITNTIGKVGEGFHECQGKKPKLDTEANKNP